MDEQTKGFRSAVFGGFRREDVLRYIEETDAKYYEESERLRGSLDDAQTAMGELRGQNEKLTEKNAELIDKYKATISILVPCNGEVGIDPSKGYKAITTPRIEVPGEVNTFSYLVLGAFDTEKEIKNYKQYLMCKFTRFMLRLTYSSMHIARANFVFVPDQDFTEEWTDEKLYKKYELTEDEIAFIESTIRVME